MMECPLCSCQLLVGYRHVDLWFIVCLECFKIIRKLCLHKDYVRYSSLLHQTYQQSHLANQRLSSFKCEQNGSLEQLLQTKAIQKCFFIKEYSENSAKLSLSTSQDSETAKELSEQGKATENKFLPSKSYNQVVNQLIDRIQPTKQIFLKKAEVMLQSATSVKQKCKMIRSECKSLVAEIPTLKSLKKGLNGFFKLF